VFGPGRPFEHCLMFVGKKRNESPKGMPSGRLWLYPQTFDWAGKEQSLELITKICNLRM
jgi:hypothetical protein